MTEQSSNRGRSHLLRQPWKGYGRRDVWLISTPLVADDNNLRQRVERLLAAHPQVEQLF